MRQILLIACCLLIGFAAAQADQWQHLIIVHTNDIHGHLPPEDAVWMNPNFPPPLSSGPGAALFIKEERERARQNGYGFLLTEGGDVFSGAPVGEATQGHTVVQFMNLLGYDAMAVGNHDFDKGEAALIALAHEAAFPVLAANIVDSVSRQIVPYVKPYTIVERCGLRIGIIGVLYDRMRNVSKPEHIKGLDFLKEIPTLRSWVDSVRAQNVDLVIGLLHTGIQHDKIFADSIPGIDVIIGAHSHTGMPEAYEDPANHTIVVQDYANMSSIGELDLSIDPATKQIVGYKRQLKTLTTEEMPMDTTFKRLVREWQVKAEAGFDSVIGVARINIANQGGTESQIGDLISDAMREAVRADFAFQNSAGIRGEFPAGDITYRSVYKTESFGNTIVTTNMTGAQVIKVCETSVLGFHAIFQVSGLSMKYNPKKPIWHRVSEVLVDGQPIDTAKIYRVATNDFIGAGGGNYKVFREGTDWNDTFLSVRQAMVDYIKKHSPLATQIEGRILVTSGGRDK